MLWSGPLSLFAATCSDTTSAGTVLNTSCLPQPSGDTIAQILTIVFEVSAGVALLMIVINGFRYIVARGDPNATASAKNGVLYAVVGLLVVMAAYSIVAFTVKGVG